MFALWDADGNEIRDEYPQEDPYDILRNPDNAVFDLDMVVGKLKEIGGSDIVTLHQLAQNHYFVINDSPVSQHPLWKSDLSVNRVRRVYERRWALHL